MVTVSARSAGKSTIVRAEFAGSSWRHGALALAERYAPGLGAWLAVRMWMTLPTAAPAAARPRLGQAGGTRGRADGRAASGSHRDRILGAGPGRLPAARLGRVPRPARRVRRAA